jgi:hypothetical protein
MYGDFYSGDGYGGAMVGGARKKKRKSPRKKYGGNMNELYVRGDLGTVYGGYGGATVNGLGPRQARNFYGAGSYGGAMVGGRGILGKMKRGIKKAVNKVSSFGQKNKTLIKKGYNMAKGWAAGGAMAGGGGKWKHSTKTKKVLQRIKAAHPNMPHQQAFGLASRIASGKQ